MALSDLYKTINNLDNKRTSQIFSYHIDSLTSFKDNNERFKMIFCFTGMYMYAHAVGHISRDEYNCIKKEFTSYVNKFEKA